MATVDQTLKTFEKRIGALEKALSTHIKGKRLTRFLRNLRSGRQLVGYGQRLGFSRLQTYHLVRWFRICASPFEFLRRKLVAWRTSTKPSVKISIDRRQGYGLFAIADIPEGPPALAVANLLAAERKDHFVERAKGKAFLVNLIEPKDFKRHPELVDLALSDALLSAATRYLGTVPIWAAMEIWYTPPNKNASDIVRSSQFFHRDQEDFRQIKMFISLKDLDETTGPFRFYPAEDSQRAFQEMGCPLGRIDDEELFAHLERDALMPFVGPAGSGAAVDTSRCYHYGGRNNENERLLFMIQYLRYHEILESRPFLPTDLRQHLELQGLQRLAFPSRRYYFTDVPWRP